MADIILVVLLIFGVLMGLKRGFVLQLFHLAGFIVAFVAAALYYDDLGSRFSLWIPYPELPEEHTWASFLQSMPLENGFYNAVAFAVIFFSVKIIMQIIASMLDFVASLPILRSVNKLLGGVLGFLEVYLILFVVLYILALTPLVQIQEFINSSSIAWFIIEHTPYFSEKLTELWFTHAAPLLES